MEWMEIEEELHHKAQFGESPKIKSSSMKQTYWLPESCLTLLKFIVYILLLVYTAQLILARKDAACASSNVFSDVSLVTKGIEQLNLLNKDKEIGKTLLHLFLYNYRDLTPIYPDKDGTVNFNPCEMGCLNCPPALCDRLRTRDVSHPHIPFKISRSGVIFEKEEHEFRKGYFRPDLKAAIQESETKFGENYHQFDATITFENGFHSYAFSGIIDVQFLRVCWVKNLIRSFNKESLLNQKRPEDFSSYLSFNNRGIDYSQTYLRSAQEKRFKKKFNGLLEHLERGHLAARSSFYWIAEKETTFVHHNVTPLFKDANQMMTIMEDYKNKSLPNKFGEIISYTGTLGQLQMKNLQNQDEPLFLAADEDNEILPLLPVGEIVFVILVSLEHTKSIVFIIPNQFKNMRYATSKTYCETKIAITNDKFKQMKDVKKIKDCEDDRRPYACNLADFFGHTSDLPALNMIRDELVKKGIEVNDIEEKNNLIL